MISYNSIINIFSYFYVAPTSLLTGNHSVLYIHESASFLFYSLVCCIFLDSTISAITSFHGGSDGKEFACNAGYWGLIPGLGRHPGEGNGNPL